jgi:hypothetical protein
MDMVVVRALSAGAVGLAFLVVELGDIDAAADAQHHEERH